MLREPSVVDELMEIVSQRPCFASRDPTKPLSCLKTTVVGGCQGVGLRKNGERGYPSIPPNQDLQRLQIVDLLLDR